MHNFLSKWLFFYPVRMLRGEQVHKFIDEIKRVQKLSTKDIERFQLSKLNSLIKEAKNIPYYSDFLPRQGIFPHDLNSIKEIQKFPIVDKDFYLKEGNNLRNRIIKRHAQRSTSGSTGKPFVFFKDRYASACMDAVMYHSYSWHGISIGERQARFWGMPVSKKKRIETILKDFLMNRIRLSAFSLDEQNLKKFYYRLFHFRPGYFYGYASLIYEFAFFCDKNNLSFDTLKLKAIIVTGEKVVKEQMDFVENFFRTKVVQEYGSTETGVIGFECVNGNMHVMPNIILEVIKDGKSVVDESGEIVITELNVKSYPFIRYNTGDLGVLLSRRCSCGLNYPLLKIEEGRQDDYIITPKGLKVYDAILAYVINGHKESVHSFKAIQRKISLIDIYIVPSKQYNEFVEFDLLQSLKQNIDQTINIKFHKVEKIPREKSGKLRYFVSEIN